MERIHKDYRHHILTIVLILIIAIILLYDMIYFISGPMVINAHKDAIAQSKMVEKTKLSGCTITNRFVDEEIVYISQCEEKTVFYKEDGSVLLKKEIPEFDPSFWNEDSSSYEISLGYYKNSAVYVLKNEEREVLVDVNQHTVVRDYWKGR